MAIYINSIPMVLIQGCCLLFLVGLTNHIAKIQNSVLITNIIYGKRVYGAGRRGAENSAACAGAVRHAASIWEKTAKRAGASVINSAS